MADADYQRLLPCNGCGTAFCRLVQRGRLPFKCPGCRVLPTLHPYPSGRRICVNCGSTFESQRAGTMYCGRKCAERAQVLKQADRPRPPKPEREPIPARPCEYCEAKFSPDWRCTARAKFCSKACKAAASKVRTGLSRSPRQRAMHAMVKALRKLIEQRERLERTTAHQARKAAADADSEAKRNANRPCRECGQQFAPGESRVFCGSRCRVASERAQKKASRKAGKMRRRCAVVETFRDAEILERDGWRCQICGIATPTHLRGSYEPDAPEVDHIVAIANGGAHARWNCQCACRRCNLAKGAGTARGRLDLLTA